MMTDRSRVSSVLEDESPAPSTPAARLPLRQSARASRRVHIKTRTGCKTCKKRKIKCDEQRPSCQNCTKHNVTCDFIHSAQASSPSVTPSVSGEPPLDMLNFELLHNFTISTYSTLSNDETMRGLWKTDIVRLGTKCDYVMRAILAVSALHIAQHRPEKSDYYVAHGVLHHQIASRTAIRLMREPNEANFEALWVFSVLTIYFALGSPRDHTSLSLLIGESSFPDWIFLLNGVKHLLECLQMAPYKGLLSPVLEIGARRWQASHEPHHAESTLLKTLEERIASTLRDETLLEIYQEAIDELRCQLSFTLSADYRSLDIIDAFVWQFAMAERFFPLLKIPTQEAIAIFAHHCIVLNRLEGHKWLQGWAVCLISRAWDLLDVEHRPWIQWPIEEIGWVPS